MAQRTLLGMETEYAVIAVDEHGASAPRARVVDAMLAAARDDYPHLRDLSGGGLFLTNGARLYVDRGSHPEFATPECADPREVLHYVREGEALLLELAERARGKLSLREVQVLRSNVDYSGAGATWGCHESYLYRTNPALLPAQLVPHLITRLIYAGPGGFNPYSSGADFTLSPRSWTITMTSSPDSTCNRGIFHLKNETLGAPGYNRLHVICGESLCSDTAALLKIATTALILATIDAGLFPGTPVRLATPVEALRTVAAQQDRRRGLTLADGGRLSAAEIQRHYLAEVEQCRERGLLPAWAGPVCALWHRQLDACEAESPERESTLDWAIKRSLYQRWSRDRVPWDQLPHYGEVLRSLELGVKRLPSDLPVTIEGVLSRNSCFLQERILLERLLKAQGMTSTELRSFIQQRNQLFETDLRFGQLGPRGIFTQLDRSGLLTHRLDQAAIPLRPRGEAPAYGRAHLRGELVRAYGTRGNTANSRIRCDWTSLIDQENGSTMDLVDPFVERATWRQPSCA